MPVFPAPVVIDRTSLAPRSDLVGLSGTVVYPETEDPVQPLLEYGSGEEIPGSVLTVSGLGDPVPYCLTPFVTPDGVYEVEFLAPDGTRSFLSTDRGAQLAAEAARTAAQSALAAATAAAAAAAAAQEAAQSLALPGGGLLGDVLTKTGPATTERAWRTPSTGGSSGGGAGGNTYTITGASQPRNNPLTGAVLPSPPSAVVIWIAETRPAAMVNGDQWYIPVTTG